MENPSNMENDWQWSSHTPVLKTLTKIFNFDFILELGTGKNSTPILGETKAELLCIDNDLNWLNYTKSLLPNRTEKTQFIHHDLGEGIVIGTKVHELVESKKHEIKNYYNNLASKIPTSGLKMCFVDQFTCARTFSINALLDKFDVLAYHDCEPAGVPWYEYYFDKEKTKEYDIYMFKTSIVWTGFFIKKGLDFNISSLLQTCQSESLDYAQKIGADVSSMTLEQVSEST